MRSRESRRRHVSAILEGCHQVGCGEVAITVPVALGPAGIAHDRVNDIGSNDPDTLTLSGDFAFFTSHTQEEGFEIWRTDGTDAGTVREVFTHAGVAADARAEDISIESYAALTAGLVDAGWQNPTAAGARARSSRPDTDSGETI